VSSKQAKRIRQQQRAAGIEPHLDAKRRLREEALEREQQRLADLAAFRRDHPEQYAAEQRDLVARGRRALGLIGSLAALV
jgi:hypothetical protein